MTFDPARPRYTLPFAGETYDLLGTFGLIEAVEHALQRGVAQIAVEVTGPMPAYDLAKLVAAVLSASGSSMKPKEAGDLLWNKVGLVGEENATLRLHLYAFLSICLAPPPEREAKANDMGKLIGSLEAGSPGETTTALASAS